MPVTAAYYPVDDTSLPADERAYLQQLQDYAEHQNLEQDVRPLVRILSIFFTVFATLVVGLRFAARRKTRTPFWVDDWLILAALALLFANLAFNLVMIEQGLGLHSGRLTLGQLERLNQTIVGAEVVYLTGVNMYKSSLLFLYFRIFPLPQVRKWGYICGAVTTGWNLACVLAALFQCTPRNKIWEPWVDGYCIDIFLTQLCVSVPSILCDIAILCLPLPHVLRLNTNRTQKVFLVIIFMLGSYVVFTSIYRFVVYLSYSKSDIPYTLGIPCAWNIIEISSGIVSSSLPTLGPIVRLIIKSVMPSTLAKSGGKSDGPAGYGGRRGTSPYGLVTIGGTGGTGGDPYQSKGRWTNLDHSQGSGSRTPMDAQYGITDIEMDRKTTTTTIVSAAKVSEDNSKGVDERLGNSQVSVAGSKGSDEIPIMGIRQTVQVEWTVEHSKRREQQGSQR